MLCPTTLRRCALQRAATGHLATAFTLAGLPAGCMLVCLPAQGLPAVGRACVPEPTVLGP